jgi:hypothetical protein
MIKQKGTNQIPIESNAKVKSPEFNFMNDNPIAEALKRKRIDVAKKKIPEFDQDSLGNQVLKDEEDENS